MKKVVNGGEVERRLEIPGLNAIIPRIILLVSSENVKCRASSRITLYFELKRKR